MSTENTARKSSIWLEVANVRLEGEIVEIQVKGDRADCEPVWRKVNLMAAAYSEPERQDNDKKVIVAEKKGHDTAYRTISEGLDRKRIVLAKLAGTPLECTSIRIQYADSNSR